VDDECYVEGVVTSVVRSGNRYGRNDFFDGLIGFGCRLPDGPRGERRAVSCALHEDGHLVITPGLFERTRSSEPDGHEGTGAERRP
jgi:hypothetical protein